MATFDSVGAIQVVLETLSEQPEPLARLLPRRPGQKEERWQQLVAAEITEVEAARSEQMEISQPEIPSAPSVVARTVGSEDHADMSQHRVDLEKRVETLQSELAALRVQVAELATLLNVLRESLGE